MNEVLCICENIIKDNIIQTYIGFDDESQDDYSVVSAICDKCKAKYSAFEWGEFDDLEQAKNFLQEHIYKIRLFN